MRMMRRSACVLDMLDCRRSASAGSAGELAGRARQKTVFTTDDVKCGRARRSGRSWWEVLLLGAIPWEGCSLLAIRGAGANATTKFKN